ncbi:hypothetical protein PT974_04613 [Cladobotryum mycophilum]|uniref:LAGLIDADG endonuclease n=1 Tax=Cladobotryum mycophilum TaxID=491253 RepID=A0ABR0SWN0_9HYPO
MSTSSEFDCIIACSSDQECTSIVAVIKDFKGYKVKEQKRDWVNMTFTGEAKGDGSLPEDYIRLEKYLFNAGFIQTWSHWGSRRFQKQ